MARQGWAGRFTPGSEPGVRGAARAGRLDAMSDAVSTSAKRAARRLLATRLYPRPVSELHPAGLYAYLDALYERRELAGAVVEVGCWLGGTAALARQLMDRAGMRNRYVCVDTFGGFVASQ